MDINKLVEGIKRRDERALGKIMDIYVDSVHYLCKSILRVYEKEDIEECVQDTFIAVWKDIDKYEEGRGTLKSFILIKARTIALNKKTKLSRVTNIVPIDDRDFRDNEIIEEKIVSLEERKELLKAIGNLKEEDREIFIRRYFYNQSIKQIAEACKLTVSAAENRLWRGREKLKVLLQKNKEGRVLGEK